MLNDDSELVEHDRLYDKYRLKLQASSLAKYCDKAKTMVGDRTKVRISLHHHSVITDEQPPFRARLELMRRVEAEKSNDQRT